MSFIHLWQSLRKLSKDPSYKIVSHIFKLLLTAVILYYVFRGLEPRLILHNMLKLPLGVIFLLILSSFLRHCIQLQVWKLSLRLNPAYIWDARAELNSYLIGLPLAFIFPGGHASVGKMFWVKNTSHFASIIAYIAEKGYLTWAMWSFAAAAALMHYPNIPISLGMPLFLLLLSAPLWSEFLFLFWKQGAVYRRQYAKKAPLLALYQIAAAMIALSQYWLILNSIKEISYLDNFKLMSLTNFSNTLPITLAGLGLRESFAIHFLKNASFAASEAIAATLSLFVIQDVIPALVGLVALWKQKK